ncbi:LOW QUALITY PROTEIN: protein IMPACT-like [Homalodisca vitripennis]|uniref:LOW QUALITY PROTEIN: protein IMPACT-like n=1 Tax=Homalodisca vitripennis TaxID=197043 RepID=UPI001EE9ED63|nr:LOW QUALITY PROTEIN: protein IMPACT-like [Homalodisca vitripennis]
MSVVDHGQERAKEKTSRHKEGKVGKIEKSYHWPFGWLNLVSGQIVSIEKALQADMNGKGRYITDRKSKFQAHAAIIISVDQVKGMLSTLLENKKFAQATHNIYAYRVLKDGLPGCMAQDCEDDGENAAGSRLLHLLQTMGAMNVMVVVSRWYGGVHLGPDRFRHINNCSEAGLATDGLRQQKVETGSCYQQPTECAIISFVKK